MGIILLSIRSEHFGRYGVALIMNGPVSIKKKDKEGNKGSKQKYLCELMNSFLYHYYNIVYNT